MSDTMKASEWGMSKEFQALFDTLNPRHKAFWYHYWQSDCRSKKKSALAAGYKESGSKGVAWQITRSEKGRKIMQFYLDEVAVTAETILSDLHEMNHSSMEDFRYLLGPKFNKEMDLAGSNLKQVKKINVTRRTVGTGDEKYEVENVSIELYDRLKVLDTQSKIRKLYSENTTNINITYEQALSKLEDAKEGVITDPDHVAKMLEGRFGS